MAKGGYLIVDFKNVPATTAVPVSTPGVYKTLESNYGKATLVSGVVIGGKSYPEEFVTFKLDSSNYTATMADGTTISVTNEDKTTFTTAVE